MTTLLLTKSTRCTFIRLMRNPMARFSTKIEQWEDIIGYPNYQVSDLGNVKNKKFNRNLQINIERFKEKNRPIRVNLVRDNNKRSCEYVHRLVAKYFVPNPNNYKMVDHKDANMFNNHASNLRWIKDERESHPAPYTKKFEMDNQKEKAISSKKFNA
eukprot:424894_1